MERDPTRLLTADELKRDYIRRALAISRIQSIEKDCLYKISELIAKQRDLMKAANAFDRHEAKIEELEKQREEIGWLQVNDRLNLEEDIMWAKDSKRMDVELLQEKHGIEPEMIPARWQEADRELTNLKAEKDKLPDLGALRERQKEAGRQYQAALVREAAQEKKPERAMTHGDKMAIARAENELEKLARSASMSNQGTKNEAKNEKSPKQEHGPKLEMRI